MRPTIICLRLANKSLLLLALSSLAILGCRETAASGQAASGAGADLSGPVQYSAKFQARMPRKCNGPNRPPNESQAVALVQCAVDQISDTKLQLAQNAKVQMGGARPFNMRTDSAFQDIDTAAQVIPLHGSYTYVSCSEVTDYMQNAGKNCMLQDFNNLKGACYRTSFGNWECWISGDEAETARNGQPGPKTY